MLSRRDLIQLTGAGLAAASAGLAAGCIATRNEDAKPGDADLVVFNARVYTVDPNAPKAEAFAVKGDRFLAVGTSQEMKGLAGKRTQMYDAKGMTVLPGMIDCHLHPSTGTTILYELLVGNPYACEIVTIDETIAKLRKKAAETPPGIWVEGYFFDDTKVKDGRSINIHDLDKASTDHAIEVHHRGGHISYYNSKAFALAGITKNTPNPPDGTFEHGPDGELTGRVNERARSVFNKVKQRVKYTPEQEFQRNRDGQALMSKAFVKSGLTSVHHSGGDLTALQQLRERGELLHRVSYEAGGQVLEAMITSGIRTGFGDEWIRFGAASEYICDGSCDERTMSIKAGYPGTNPPFYGIIVQGPDVLNPWVERMYRAGIQPNVHANGDIAIDMYLTAIERAQKLVPVKDMRPKITHCTLINDDLLRRIKAVDAVPAMFETYLYYNGEKWHLYGEDFMSHAMAYRSMADAGIVAAFGSDFVCGPFDPLLAIQGIVTRKGWNGEVWGANQRTSVDEALRIGTINGAYNSHEERIKGSITPGKLADYVVLAEDLHMVDPEKIKDIKVVRTVVGGRVVYQA